LCRVSTSRVCLTHPIYSDAADYVRGRFMSPPILKNRLAAHLHENARPGLLSAALLDLIVRMLCFNPTNRITAADALRHPYFADCEEASIDDGEVAVPDDGEGMSVPQIFESLRRLRENLREQRLQDANFVWGVWELPGM
jgi:serine/threonine protein kinase